MREVKATPKSVLGFFVTPPGQSVTQGGIHLLDDNGKTEGIKTRFFEIHDVGASTIVSTDIKKGDIVAVPHGRWSRGFDIGREDGKKIHALDPKDIMMIYEGDISKIV